MKIFGLIPLKDGWDRDSWLQHYTGRHGPLVRSTTSFSRHFRRYHQNTVVPGEDESEAIAISELWTDDAGKLELAYAEKSYVDIIQPDEEFFTDASAIVGGLAREVEICRASATDQPGYKLFILRQFGLVEAEQAAIDKLEAAWTAKAAKLVPSIQGSLAVSYVQNFPLSAREWQGFDVVDVLSASDLASLKTAEKILAGTGQDSGFESEIFLPHTARSLFMQSRVVFD